MNSCNLYTLRKFHSKHCTDLSDPFQRDPFKIKSYNFHYADKPSYPVKVLKPKQPWDKQNGCQTFFYNNDFSSPNTVTSLPLKPLANSAGLTKFQETRRRNFLQESYSSGRNSKGNFGLYKQKNKIVSTTKGNIRKSYDFQNPVFKTTPLIKAHSSVYQNFQAATAAAQQGLSSGYENVVTAAKANTRHSPSSCCEININIKNFTDASLNENLSINIETDSVTKNLNIPLNKSIPKLNDNTFKTQQSYQSQRLLELKSIYSSQNLKKPLNKIHKSPETLPQLIPFKANSSRISKENQIRSSRNLNDLNKTFVSSSNNNFSNSPYESITKGGPKLLNSYASQTKKFNNSRQPPLVSSQLRTDLKTLSNCNKSSRSSIQMPLKVNINVYTDKLKYMR